MTVIASRHVVTGSAEHDEPIEATLYVERGRIVSVAPGIEPQAEVVQDYVVPGFVDTHSHGADGANFADDDAEAVERAIDFHRRHGSTTLFASTVSENLDDLADQIRRLRRLVETDVLRGIHLEGPFLASERKGAHNIELLRDPTEEAINRLVPIGGGAVRMITLAPERSFGLQAVAALHQAGVVAAFGHSNAEAEVTRESIDAGVTVVTHLFNAMRGIHHREPGPIPVLLTDRRVMVELICDGTHVHPDVVRMAIAAAGVERVALVTDAMSATGKPDGEYQLGSLQVRVADHVARILQDDGSLGAIAGSTLTMDSAFAFCVQQVGCSIPDTALMASATPARWHQLSDVGTLEVGKWADVCVVDQYGDLQRVMRRGEWLDAD